MTNELNNVTKWKHTLTTTVIFLLVSHPFTYKLVQKIFGNLFTVANSSGCPTITGLILHTLVFTLVLRLKME